MRSIQRLRLTAWSSFLPLLEKAEVSIWFPDCRSDQIHRSRTRGTIESLLAILLIRPYRCEECDYRFFAAPFEANLRQPGRQGQLMPQTTPYPRLAWRPRVATSRTLIWI
jgi:hypothetical protein